MIKLATHICILGGGFSGLYTALYMQRFRWPKSQNCQITLVDQKDHLVFTPLLYELIADELQPWEIAPSYKKLLSTTNIQFCQGKVQGVDLEKRQVKLQSVGSRGFSQNIGRDVEVFDQNLSLLVYDYLVLAVGVQMRLNSVPGAATYAAQFRSVADAERLKKQLQLLEASDQKRIRIAIVGGGPNGVELACKLADRLQGRGQVQLIERGKEILKTFSPHSRAAAHRALKKRGVQVDLETSIDAIESDQIAIVRENQITNLTFDLVLWTAGTQPMEWVRNLACRHNSQGQLLALPTLQLVDYPEVFALGDLADIRDAQGIPVPATAQVAYQQANCAAWNLWASVTGRPLRGFRYLHLGEMLTLGTKEAVVSSFALNLEGHLACVTRRLVYLGRLPTRRHRFQVFRHWLASWVTTKLRCCRRQLARLSKVLPVRRGRRSANQWRRTKY